MTVNEARRLAGQVAFFALLSEFTLSGNLLEAAGVPYMEDGGSFFAKLHPGTYLAGVAMITRLTVDVSSLRTLGSIACVECTLAIYLGAISFCIIYAASLTGFGGIATLVDTYLSAGMLGVALRDITRAQVARLALMLQLLFAFNAVLSLVEAASGSNLVPTFTEIMISPREFRPTALYDHPLTGAAATVMGLLLAPDGRSAPHWRLSYGLLMLSSLIAFGGRVALVVAIFSTILLLARRFCSSLPTPRISKPYGATSLILAILVIPVIGAIFAFGLAGRLSAHMYWDQSAQVRIGQFHLLQMMSIEQVIFGCSRSALITLLEPLRLSYGVAVIENFWLLIFVTLGAICFPIFVIAILALMRWLWVNTDEEGRVMVAGLIVVASTSNSLGRKSTLLIMLVGCVMARKHYSERKQPPQLRAAIEPRLHPVSSL